MAVAGYLELPAEMANILLRPLTHTPVTFTPYSLPLFFTPCHSLRLFSRFIYTPDLYNI